MPLLGICLTPSLVNIQASSLTDPIKGRGCRESGSIPLAEPAKGAAFFIQEQMRAFGTDNVIVTVPASLSPIFYGWVFQYTGEMKILAPEHVQEAYAKHLGEAQDETPGG